MNEIDFPTQKISEFIKRRIVQLIDCMKALGFSEVKDYNRTKEEPNADDTYWL
jgi:hypothetical protein